MKSCINMFVAFALMSSPAVADNFIVASPDMSLTEAAQAKFNHDTGTSGDRYVKPVPGNAAPTRQLYASAGLSPDEAQGWTIDEVFVAKINREGNGDSRQLAPASVSLGYGQASGDHSRLAFAARVSPDDAGNMSGAEIAEAYLNREH